MRGLLVASVLLGLLIIAGCTSAQPVPEPGVSAIATSSARPVVGCTGQKRLPDATRLPAAAFGTALDVDAGATTLTIEVDLAGARRTPTFPPTTLMWSGCSR